MGFRNYKYNNINNENCNYDSTNRDNGNIGIENVNYNDIILISNIKHIKYRE